jgi:hypothetical protein
MDRLDEIEYKNNGGYASQPPTTDDIRWLIAEVKRLRQDQDWPVCDWFYCVWYGRRYDSRVGHTHEYDPA